MKNISMRDIGRMAGVSAVTVSKALAGKRGVSEEMRRKIVRLAEEMGYVNPLGGQVKPAHSLDVGILIPDHFFSPDSFYALLYKELVQTLTDAGHFGILEMLTAEAEANLTLPHVMSGRHVDALVLLGQPGEAYRQMIAKQAVPVVFLDFYDTAVMADAVVGDSIDGASRLTEHLIEKGHRDIGFVGDVQATSSIMERYLGFASAMMRHSLPIRPECVIRDRDEQGTMLPLDLPEKLPTAFVCNCDAVAAWVIEQLSARGIRVPEDVSVTGYDDFLPGSPALPRLTTFRVNRKAMVQAAVRLVMERCSGMDKPVGRVVVGGEPVYGESVKEIVCNSITRPIGSAD